MVDLLGLSRLVLGVALTVRKVTRTERSGNHVPPGTEKKRND
jgi:hypothetical protein